MGIRRYYSGYCCWCWLCVSHHIASMTWPIGPIQTTVTWFTQWAKYMLCTVVCKQGCKYNKSTVVSVEHSCHPWQHVGSHRINTRFLTSHSKWMQLHSSMQTIFVYRERQLNWFQHWSTKKIWKIGTGWAAQKLTTLARSAKFVLDFTKSDQTKILDVAWLN